MTRTNVRGLAPSPQSAVAQVRAHLIAVHRLRSRDGYPEELENPRDPSRGVAVSYASQAVWVRPMSSRIWVRIGHISLDAWGKDAWKAKVEEIVGDHFASDRSDHQPPEATE